MPYVFHIYVTAMEIGLRKRQRGSDAFMVFGFWCECWWIHRQMAMFLMHVQWFSHWKIRADDCDVMK